MLDNKLMKVVSEIISTGCSAMAIIDGEEGAPRPVGVWKSSTRRRFQDVQDYGYSIFIVISDKSLIGIRCIGTH